MSVTCFTGSVVYRSLWSGTSHNSPEWRNLDFSVEKVNPAAQVAEQMESVVVYEYEPAAHLLVTDEDAADFLQSQFTNELRPFQPGRSTYGLWLDVKGKVVADSFVLCEGAERFRIFSEGSAAETLADKLRRHIIADEVEIELLPAGRAMALVGAQAGELLRALGLVEPAAGCFTQAEEVRVYRGRRSEAPNFELWAPSAAALDAYKQRLVEQSLQFVGCEPMQALRVAAGIPSVPVELGPGDLPGEGGLVGDAVSLTKGCYLGQEVVSRMHHVGRPQRGLFRISGSGGLPDCPLAVYQGEKPIGELRSAFAAGARWQGVAMLKTRFVEVGAALRSAAGDVQVDGRFEKASAEGAQ